MEKFEEKARFLWEKAPLSTNFTFKYNPKKKKMTLKLTNRDDTKPLHLTHTAYHQQDIGRLIQLNKFLLQEALGVMKPIDVNTAPIGSMSKPQTSSKKKKKSKKKH